jgi:hypothetical protein
VQVRKSPIKRRARALYKIWVHHSENLKKEGSSVDRKSVTSRRRKFSYNAQERGAIADELVVKPDAAPASLDESLDEIETLVRQTFQADAYRQDHPVEENLQQRFRALDKPIDKILSVLDASEFQHLTDTVPNLRTELDMLRRMVEADHRKGRGRPPDPANVLHHSLIAKLAEVWARHHEEWPKRWHRDDKGRDWGPFYRFLDTCLKPADIRVSDYVIRNALSVGEK